MAEDPGAPSYPPPVHVLRDLALDIEALGDGVTRGHLAALPTASAGGATSAVAVPFGAVVTATDVLAGALCARTVAPDWMATSVMSFHLDALDPARDVVLDGSVLRSGGRTVTIEVVIAHPTTTSAPAVRGSAILTFSRLERRATTLVLPEQDEPLGARRHLVGAADPTRAPEPTRSPTLHDVAAAVGCRVVAPGRTETAITDYVRNSFGAVNGGVVAAIADETARSLVADLGDWRTTDLTANYLGQGRGGPVVASSRVVRRDGGSCTVRVEVVDEGLLDDEGRPRRMVVAHAVLCRVGT